MVAPMQNFRGQTPLGVQRTAQPMMQTTAQPQAPQQQYGLAGAEQAIQAGLGAGTSALQQGASLLAGGNFQGAASSVDPNTGQPLFQQAAQGVGAYSPAGLQAQQQQLALSGAQGQEAFTNALMTNPGTELLKKEAMNAVINQGAATGGLGGGNVLKALQDRATGLAAQDLNNQYNRAAGLSSQGLQAAGQQGQFLSQAGQQMGNLASTNAQLGTQASLANANNRLQAAGQQANMFGQAANMFGNAGNNIAGMRNQAGRDIASNIGQGTSALSGLVNQQGSGISDMIGQGAANVGNLISGAGQFNAGQQNLLAQLYSNLATQQGTQNANALQAIGQAQAGGISGAAGAQRDTLLTAAAALSDVNLKSNIVKTGVENGFNTYSWTWNEKHPDKSKVGLNDSGVIAQEVELKMPEAVSLHDSGYKQVDYSMIGVKNG